MKKGIANLLRNVAEAIEDRVDSGPPPLYVIKNSQFPDEEGWQLYGVNVNGRNVLCTFGTSYDAMEYIQGQGLDRDWVAAVIEGDQVLEFLESFKGHQFFTHYTFNPAPTSNVNIYYASMNDLAQVAKSF